MVHIANFLTLRSISRLFLGISIGHWCSIIAPAKAKPQDYKISDVSNPAMALTRQTSFRPSFDSVIQMESNAAALSRVVAPSTS
jgi:hypothetical protein